MAENNGYNELLHELNLQPKSDTSPPTSTGGEGKTLADYVQTKDSSGIRVLPDSAHESPDAPTQVTVKTDDETPVTDDTAQLSEEPAADSGALEDTNSTNESDIEGEDELTSDDSRDMSALSQGEEDEEDEEDEDEYEYEGIPDDADDRGYGDEGSFFSRTSTKIGLGAIAFSFLVIGFIALGGINGGADDSYRNSDIAAPDRNLSADEITSGDYEDDDDYYDDDRDTLYDDDDYYDDDESSDDEVDDSDRNVDYVDTDDSSNGYYPGPTDPQGTHLDNTTQQAGGSQQPQQQPQQQRPTGQKPAVKPAPAPKPSQKPNGSVQERPGAGGNETPPAVETVYQTPDRE